MRIHQKPYVLPGLAVIAIILLVIYISEGDDAESLEEMVLKKLRKIQEEQQKQVEEILKSDETIDQEVSHQLSLKNKVNKSIEHNSEFDIRGWFDRLPQTKPSSKPLKGHPLFHGFTIENSDICANESVDILIYIHSATENLDKRNVLRKTWGSTRLFTDIVVRTIFILGMPKEASAQLDILTENSAYGDIVQANFDDTFENITHKAITTLAWINSYCSQAKVILKSDDDIFVDLMRVVKELMPLMDTRKSSVACDYIKGGRNIIRDPKRKWYVPKKYLPSTNKFPAFCSGYFTLMSGNLIPVLYERTFQPEKFVTVDDAYLYGILTDGFKGINVTDLHGKVSYLARPDPVQEIKTNGKFEYLAFAIPAKAENLWSMRLQKLNDWERPHSLYFKFFGQPHHGSVVID